MAKFKIAKSTTVAKLKEQFRCEFGGTLRVYEGRSEAPEYVTLVSLGAKEGDLECRASRTVGKFEEAFQDKLNLKVKVYPKDNNVSVLDGITLSKVKDIPNMSTHAKMEQFLAYQRDEKEEVNEEAESHETENSVEKCEPLPNPKAIYFVIDSEPNPITEEDEDCGEYWFLAYRAIKDCQYVYGVWRHDPHELADELGVDIEDIEVFYMDYSIDSVENYPSGKNIYLPQWLYELYTSPDSNIAELCPYEDAEPIRAAISCCLTDQSSDWLLDEEVPCILRKANGQNATTWLASKG